MKKPKKLRRVAMETLIGVLLLFLFSLALNGYRAPKPIDHPLLELEGSTTLQGEKIKHDQLLGHALILHFWGTWCPICRQEASNIAYLARRYRVITIAVQSGTKQEILHWMKQKKVDYPVLNDPDGALARRFGVSIFPSTFILSPEGKVKFVETGYTTTVGLLARIKLAQ